MPDIGRDLSIEFVREKFEYDAASGVLTSRATGKIGYLQEGYRRFDIRGRHYGVHRLAWAWYYGEWPNGLIDHINGDPADNRIANLRLASQAENMRNRRAQKRRSHVLKGITPAWGGKWRAGLRIDGKYTFLGTFETAEAAHAAYVAKAKEVFGEFARSA